MITVGYGDITPKTEIEVFIAILTMLTTCGMFAYMVNKIGMILTDLQKDKKELEDTL